MISLNQVLLLEEKVENAVKKIVQLNAENAALRRKCAELTNALSAKTEQFSNFQTDQSKIEQGILKALERLNAVENAVLSAEGLQVPDTQQNPSQKQSPKPVQESAPATPAQSVLPESKDNSPKSDTIHSFDTAEPLDTELENNISSEDASKLQQEEKIPPEPRTEPENSDSLQPAFDIF